MTNRLAHKTQDSPQGCEQPPDATELPRNHEKHREKQVELPLYREAPGVDKRCRPRGRLEVAVRISQPEIGQHEQRGCGASCKCLHVFRQEVPRQQRHKDSQHPQKCRVKTPRPPQPEYAQAELPARQQVPDLSRDNKAADDEKQVYAEETAGQQVAIHMEDENAQYRQRPQSIDVDEVVALDCRHGRIALACSILIDSRIDLPHTPATDLKERLQIRFVLVLFLGRDYFQVTSSVCSKSSGATDACLFSPDWRWE